MSEETGKGSVLGHDHGPLSLIAPLSSLYSGHQRCENERKWDAVPSDNMPAGAFCESGVDTNNTPT